MQCPPASSFYFIMFATFIFSTRVRTIRNMLIAKLCKHPCTHTHKRSHFVSDIIITIVINREIRALRNRAGQIFKMTKIPTDGRDA